MGITGKGFRAPSRQPAFRHIMTVLAIMATGAGAGCADATEPEDDFFVGSWDLIGFTDAGVQGTTTGTWTFREDGTFTVDGSVTYPGEPTDQLSLTGTWSQDGSTVTFTIDGVATNWTFTTSGDVTTLTEIEDPPANVIRIRRR